MIITELESGTDLALETTSMTRRTQRLGVDVVVAAVGRHERAYFSARRLATFSGTIEPRRSAPPNMAIWRMRVAAMNELSGPHGRNTVCMPGDRLVHLRLLHLGREVGAVAQALHDHVGADVTGDVDGELGHRHDLDVVEVAEGLLDELLALLQGEQRLALAGVADRRHDDAVVQTGRGLEDVDVSVVQRIERARTEGSPQRLLLGEVRVTTVVP